LGNLPTPRYVLLKEFSYFCSISLTMSSKKGVGVRLVGALLGGALFTIVYTLLSLDFETLTLRQRLLPSVFGVLVGLLLADAWCKRKTSSTSEGSIPIDDGVQEQ